jgi:transposase
MFVLEFKAKGKPNQYAAIDEAIRTAQFVRNKCIRFWIDNRGVGQKDLYHHSTELREEFAFVKNLNSSACQASVERAYSAIARFYDNCKKAVPGKKGYPTFKKNSRSVEYKVSGWKLSETRKQIAFTDKKGIGKLKLKGTWDLNFYQIDQIKRVRLIQCSNCDAIVKKSLSVRTHVCECGFVMDRDWNAAINILKTALSTVGHTGTWVLDLNALGDSTSTLAGEILSQAS